MKKDNERSEHIENMKKESTQEFIKEGEYLSKAFDNMMFQQMDMLDKFYNTRNKKEKKLLEGQMEDQERRMKDALKDMERGFNTYSKYMGQADRKAFEVNYKNRIEDLNNLNDSISDTFDFARDEVDSLGDSWEDFGRDMRSMLDTFNISRIAESLEEDVDSVIDNTRQMSKVVGETFDRKRFLDLTSNAVTSTGNKISRKESSELLSNAVINLGIDDMDVLSDYSDSIVQSNLVLGVSVESLEGMIWADMKSGGNGKILRKTLGVMTRLNRAGLNLNYDGLVSALSEFTDTMYGLSGGDEEKLEDMSKEFTIVAAAADDSDSTLVLDLLKGMGDMTAFDFVQDEKYNGLLTMAGYDVSSVYKDFEEGNFVEVAKIFSDSLSKYDMKDYGDQEIAKILGFGVAEMRSFQASREDFDSSLQNAVSVGLNPILDENGKEIDSLTEAVEGTNVGWTTEMKNWMSNLPLLSSINDTLSELDFSAGDIVRLVSDGITIFSFLKDFKGGKFFGSIGKIFTGGKAAGSAASAAGTAGKAAGTAGKAAGVFGKAGTAISGAAGKAGTAAVAGLGKVGTTLGSAATTAGGAAAAGAAGIAGGVAAAATIGSAVVDFVDAKSQKTWQESEDKIAEGGIKLAGVGAGAAVGAAVGSVVPGLGTAIGALVGAGLGGVATLIWGDDWANQLTDWIDGTAKIKETQKKLNSVTEDLTKSLDKSKNVKELTDEYKRLQDQLSAATYGTSEYTRIQTALNSTIGQLGQIYPELAAGMEANSIAGEKSLEVMNKLSEAELSLAKARAINTADELGNTLKDYDKQIEKSKEKMKSVEGEMAKYEELTGYIEQLANMESSGAMKFDEYSGKLTATSTATDEERAILQEYTKKAEDLWKGSGYEHAWDDVNWAYDDSYNAFSVYRNIIKDNETSSIAEDYAAALKDLTMKEEDKRSALTQGVGNLEMTLGDKKWDDIASDYNNSTASEKNAFREMYELYNIAGEGFRDMFPSNIEELAKKAGIDGSHAKGLNYVPYDGYIAELHQGEMVLTAEQARNIKGSMDSGVVLDGDNKFELMKELCDNVKVIRESLEDTEKRDVKALSALKNTNTSTGGLVSAVANTISGNTSSSGSKGLFGWVKNIFGFHEEGLNYVPYDNYAAMLHQGEMVLTAEQASVYRNLNDIDVRQGSSMTPSYNENITEGSGIRISEVVYSDYGDSDEYDGNDNSDIVDAIKWAVSRIERKLDENKVEKTSRRRNLADSIDNTDSLRAFSFDEGAVRG